MLAQLRSAYEEGRAQLRVVYSTGEGVIEGGGEFPDPDSFYSGTQAKIWTGSAWETHSIKVFMGGSWTPAKLKKYNGSTWEQI